MEPQTKYAVRKLRKEEWKKWDRFVLAQRDGTVFHTSLWLRHQKKRTLEIFGLFFNGDLVGGYPVSVLIKAGFLLAVKPVMTPYNGPVISDSLIRDNEAAGAVGCLREIQSQYHAYRCAPPPQAREVAGELEEYADGICKRTNILHFVQNGNIFERFSSSVRRNIRKAEKNQVTVKESVDFELIYDLSAESFRNSGREHPLEKHAFLNLAEELETAGLAKSYLALLNGEKAIAACWAPRDRHYGYNVLHGIDRKYSDLQGGPLVLYQAISDCYNDRLGFDFEGSMQERIHTFYQKFGAEETAYKEISGINSRILFWLDKLNIKKI